MVGGEKRIYCQILNVFRAKSPAILEHFDKVLIDHFIEKIS